MSQLVSQSTSQSNSSSVSPLITCCTVSSIQFVWEATGTTTYSLTLGPISCSGSGEAGIAHNTPGRYCLDRLNLVYSTHSHLQGSKNPCITKPACLCRSIARTERTCKLTILLWTVLSCTSNIILWMWLLSDGYGVPIIPLIKAQSYDMARSTFSPLPLSRTVSWQKASICSVSVTLKSQWDAMRDEGTSTRRRGERGGRGEWTKGWEDS